ncbi:MAG: PD-(D/E)XK nuclease family protein [Acidimicrobiia bacterium]|nr:PD-(D/E)XK nuclease family protein [Acidimicrobiia bacterium]
MTYGAAPLERIDLRALERIELCPPSRRSGSKRPSPHLDRWKVVRDCTVAWHHAGMPSDSDQIRSLEKDFFSAWDPVQQAILRELFAAYRRLFPPDADDIDLEPPGGTAIHEPTNRSISVAVQVEVRSGDEVLAMRIKTGQAATTEEEAAAFYQPDETRTLVDIRLAADDIVTVPPPDDPAGMVHDLAVRWDLAQAAPARGRVAGFHCHTCDRPARCGQYPIVGDGSVTNRTRTLLVSKSRLADYARCARSATWPVLYGIPRDDGNEDEGASNNLVVGNQFHRSVAAALLSDDPGGIYEAAYGTVAPSEVEDLRWLFDQHEALWSSDTPPVTPTRTEYQFGVTFVVDGVGLDRRDRLVEEPVAVTFMAATDVNGWEGEDIAAVVEHRTGRASAALSYEADLYAVSAWHALVAIERPVDGVAVHFHHLRADPAECERDYFTADDVAAAEVRLRTVAEELARFHPADAVSPEFRVGPWCDWCDWRSRCAQFR